MGTKNINDAISRKSTAMSTEHGTPGGYNTHSSRPASGKREGSQKRLRKTNTEKSIHQEASEEVITLSLDPKVSKKKKNVPRQLQPINKEEKKERGNYA